MIDLPPLSRVAKIKRPAPTTGTGLYFLFRGDDVVYVGMSIGHVARRVGEHAENKDFDSWSWHPIPDTTQRRLKEIEAAYILALKPEYNGAGRGHFGLNIAVRNVCELLRSTVERLVQA